MSDSESIKINYLKLLELVEQEAEMDKTIWQYYYYINKNKGEFLNESNIIRKEDLNNFLRGANRFSDEFNFSSIGYNRIKEIMTFFSEALKL